MAVEEQKRDDSEVKIRAATGEADSKKHSYIRIVPNLLSVNHPLPIDVYKLKDGSRLQMVFPQGQILPEEIRATLRKATEGLFYVRSDQKAALFAFQEDAVTKILMDDSVDLDVKCDVVKNVAIVLSQEIFDNPTAENITRHKANITRIVNFALDQPASIKRLMRLTTYDYYTYTHSVNVGLYAMWLSMEYFGDKTQHDLEEMSSGFFLHDVGKSMISLRVINKPGPLTDDEWTEMRRHPSYGLDILRREEQLTPEVSIIVEQHHERLNGTGYPKGLSGDEIHPYGLVCTIADVYDALTTRRSYKDRREPFEALKIMKEEMSTHFHPDMFKTFIQLLQRNG